MRRSIWTRALPLLLPTLLGCRTTYRAEPESDPIEICKSCQDSRCTEHRETCMGDPACANCVETPYAFDCAGNDNFRALASCSCFDCATECDHMCPAGQGACQACGLTECSAETTACTNSQACTPCLADPASPGCADDPDFIAFLACACDHCGQECVWSCPDAITACSTCALGACNTEFGECLQETECAACADNPAVPACEDNALMQAAAACVCAGCEPTCGILFRCDE